MWELLTHSPSTKHLITAPQLPETGLGLEQNKYPEACSVLCGFQPYQSAWTRDILLEALKALSDLWYVEVRYSVREIWNSLE